MADRPLRVVVIGPSPPPLGGMAVQGRLLVRMLGQSGTLAEHLPTNPRLGAMEAIPVLRTLAGWIVFLFHLLPALLRAQVVHVLAASGFYFLLRVVPAVLLGRLLRRRVVVNYRGGLAEAFFSRHGFWARPILRRAHLLTVPSPFLQRVFQAQGLSATIVPNIADLERFPFAERSPLRPRLLVNRSLEPLYDVATALRAFAIVQRSIPDATMTVAGEGSEKERLSALASELGLRGVAFPGRVGNEEMPALHASHDVLVNPTTADNMPVSLLEGMASGLALVSTDAGGIPDLVTDGEDALLVPQRDPERMAEAILRVLRDEALARRLILAGRKKADGFRWESILPRLLLAYGAGKGPS